MLEGLMALTDPQAGGLVLATLSDVLGSLKNYLLIFIGFSLVIFFHELGHFVAAKLCGVRVHKFAIGFGRELFGFTKGETRYAFNALPLGGFVKMLGQEDFEIDKSSELAVKNDPRAFTSKSVGKRMIIVSAGVVMNMVFAALLFMLVFMVGIKSNPAEVGWIKPGSPAEQAGLTLGDRIIEVNGDQISDQNDLRTAIMLADPDRPVKIAYERKDPKTGKVHQEQVTVRLERDEDLNVLQLGVAPAVDTTVGLIIPEPALPKEDQLQIGDQILAVNGQAVSDYLQVNFMVADRHGEFTNLKVRRPIKDPATGETRYEEKTVRWRARLSFQPEGRAEDTTSHLLGLVPRARLTYVVSGDRADQAGLRSGDVIVRWGNQIAPRFNEISKSVEDNPETGIPVTVLRYEDGKATTSQYTVRPKVPGLLFFKRRPTVGIGLQGQENDRIVVADIVTQNVSGSPTPAAKLKGVMPRGAEITKVNGKPVSGWSALAEKFIALAGTDVKLSWTYEGQPETTSAIHIPRALGTTFPLPPARLITSIDGRSRVDVEIDGRHSPVPVNQWQGAAAVLKEDVGKTVEVEFWDLAAHQFYKKELKLTQDEIDPWPMRIQYDLSDVLPNFKLVPVQETNPAKAMMIGVRKTYYFVVQVYIMMQRMIINRSMGLEQVSGPLGIIKMGSDVASMGLPSLMYFLALISANLAVINFLPLPIFDGGVFVFLLIEKIKGRPVSIKVQIATQIIGLTLIIGVFLFVTFQDIAKWLGWA